MSAAQLPPDIEIEVTLVPTEQGGRQTAVHSGYRGQFFYNGHDWDALYTFDTHDGTVAPGETARAFAVFASPDEHLGKVEPGLSFSLREGQRVVAHGRVLRILNLAASAARIGRAASRP
jgi:elongation factor Tu